MRHYFVWSDLTQEYVYLGSFPGDALPWAENDPPLAGMVYLAW